ncbi:crotonobetainyl-CoA:carnitine CoA-transferase CaiB-like acyl-CoA transferase [Rhodobium orientis]|uniref:Formyl-CoA transferase n=1 Tax=Rhodobium orientis TaxID=34017 RepID=A0A327JM63_9HYPH|nr:CoA transferase [Rhodobium orientis]MBB4301319.1 crotonobetainyl-CoA:carnitine CoA-transferase CaiB-like acyl-CoA transferase [Rhodobium orientis]MBK5951092.1 formyl-CoA transferase [Rhodobium orientis]RAI26845.1 formyl-CoA transferase [Rhodobium orientis]
MEPAFKPLDGVRVVEMSHMILGPSCGMFLSFLGAEVIKVEPPEGDKTRDLTGMGRGFFPTFNRGKKSVTLDLKSDAGRAALDKLLKTADVFVENFRDVSLAKMGFAPEMLREKYPRLVVASCKGFLHGPYKERTALDEVVQMMTGMAYMTGPTGRPLRIGSSANDIMAGLFGALSVLAALFERDKDGKGRAVRVGLFENCLLLVAQHMVQFDIEGREAPPMPERDFSWPVYDIFETVSGRQIFVGAVTEGQWGILCRILELQELLDHPDLQSRMAQIDAREWTVPIFAKAIAKRDFDELAVAFEETGIPFSPIARPAEMYDDPHVNRPGGLITTTMADGTTFRAPGLPVEIDGQSFTCHGEYLADIGADSTEVLTELGLSEEEIAAARGASKGEAA